MSEQDKKSKKAVPHLLYRDAEPIFESKRIWVDGCDMKWYRWAWKVIKDHGLLDYTNIYERSIAYLRCYTLMVLYAELCDQAEDLHYDDDVHADEKYLSSISLGYILAKTQQDEEDLDISDLSDEEAFMICVDSQRSIIADALTDENNKRWPLEVFTNSFIEKSSDRVSREEVYNTCTAEMMEAYAWLSDGAYRLH